MANIKVTYGSVSRRLTTSSTTTWSEIETQFRNLFNIPNELQIKVSYTDEDGDVITLSSDLELQEVFSNYSNNTIKFILTTPITNNLNDDNNVFDDREKSTDAIIDEETSNLISGVSSIQIGDSNYNNYSTSKYKHVTITDEADDPLFYQQQETVGENSKSAAEYNNNYNVKEDDPSAEENQGSNDEIIVIITRNPWLHRRRERFSERNPYYSCYTFGGRSRYGCHSRNAFSRGYGCGRYRRHQHISPEIVAEKLIILHSMGFFNDNLEELVKKYNGNLEAVIEDLLFNQQNEQNEQNEQNKQVVREDRRHQHISPEIVAEKLITLHSMGFFNDNLEELVKKYNGNLEAVIEVLLFNQQNEQNEQNEQNKQVLREEKDQPMEIEEENNRSYVL